MGHKSKLLHIKEYGQFNVSAEKIMDLKISDYIVTALPSSNMSYQEALMLAMNKEKAAFKLYLGLSGKSP